MHGIEGIYQGKETIWQASTEEEACRDEDEGAAEAGPTGIRIPEG